MRGPKKTLAVLMMLAFGQLLATPSSAQGRSLAIEHLIADGWLIAGYISVSDKRSLILFRHDTHKYLVQCSILVDVLRDPRVQSACYELR